jgi:glycerophosphoryl diester phosphodiesterase
MHLSIKRKLFLGIAATSVVTAASAAGDATFGPWEAASKWDDDPVWNTTAVSDYKNRLLQGKSEVRSPANYWSKKAVERYDHPNFRYIAHRGLVDYNVGIAENTINAVENAVASGVYMVEIDAQADKPEDAQDNAQPIALHDDTLVRPLGINDRVDSHTTAYYNKGPFMRVQGAGGGSWPTNRGAFCGEIGTKIVTLEKLMTTVIDGIPGNAKCRPHPEVTFFLDPKNLNAARAIINLLVRFPKLRQRAIVKLYPNYYDNTNPGRAAELLMTEEYKAYIRKAGIPIRIMPVINVRKFIDSIDLNNSGSDYTPISNAIVYTNNILLPLATSFEVQSIESPTAWDQKWNKFARQLSYSNCINIENFRWNRDLVKVSSFWSWVVNGFVTKKYYKYYPPRISYGYRFADFSNLGQSWNWNMNGFAQQDTVNASRSTVGSQEIIAKHSTLFRCSYETETDLVAWENNRGTPSLVTTDYPIQEMIAGDNGLVAKRRGAPSTTFNSSFLRVKLAVNSAAQAISRVLSGRDREAEGFFVP